MTPIIESRLDLKLLRRGKVRDIYELDDEHLVIVTSDRLSAFDVVLPTPIPGKGAVLNVLTRFWMDKFKHIVKNHLTQQADHRRLSEELAESQEGLHPDQIEVVRRAKVIPVECVMRGYLAGSGWKDYQTTGYVCGLKLPAGLRQSEELPEPLFTPSTKANEGHDENISMDVVISTVGSDTALKLRDFSLELYKAGREYARGRGIIIADTKFEFGLIGGEVCLIDEVLTPDSSRFWPADRYKAGHDQVSFDKQIVRNYLTEISWDKTPPAPELPSEIVSRTAQAYQEIQQRLIP